MGPARDLKRYHPDWISRLPIISLSTAARQMFRAIIIFPGMVLGLVFLGLFGLSSAGAFSWRKRRAVTV